MKKLIVKTFNIAMIPKVKAGYVSIGFFLAGVISFFYHHLDWQLTLPILIFYTVLCINTFYSIRIFTAITSVTDIAQWITDFLLIFLYVWLAWYIGDAQISLFIASLMFAAATIKYTLLQKTSKYRNLLRKKIVIDSIGTFGTILAYGATIFIHPTNFVWIWSISFVLVNIYILVHDPLYTLRHDQV